MACVERFHIQDLVTWNEKSSFHMGVPAIAEMIARYGKGPFLVVGVRLHVHHQEAGRPSGFHPEVITIELKEGVRDEFSGGWFKKFHLEAVVQELTTEARVIITLEKAGQEAKITVFNVSVETDTVSSPETYGSEAELKAFLRGVEVGGIIIGGKVVKRPSIPFQPL